PGSWFRRSDSESRSSARGSTTLRTAGTRSTRPGGSAPVQSSRPRRPSCAASTGCSAASSRLPPKTTTDPAGCERIRCGIIESLRASKEDETMDVQQLQSTARALVAEGKGILAADESTGTIKKRFDSIGVESTEETRRAYRELLFSTEGADVYLIEVMLDVTHTIAESSKATGRVLQALYTELHDQRLDFRGTLLKPNMVLSGYEASDRASADEVADVTLECFYKHVPAAVPGVVFLSGGQSDED